MYKIFVKGVVQGVGFRPFVYRVALENNVKGHIRNIGSGVEILSDKKIIIEHLKTPPPLSKIHSIDVEKIDPPKEYKKFEILKSHDDNGETILPPDIFTCENCIKELRDKKDRRYEYFFITCTDCGPRFSIIEDYPYDRPYTSMDDFPMCDDCKKEYTNPLDRRYHAQTVACHKCGPRLKLLKDKDDISEDSEKNTIKKAAILIKQGELVAIKGVGGFHIACNTSDKTIEKLREHFGRPTKPFALMVKDEEMLTEMTNATDEEIKLIKSCERPIVAVRKNRDYKFEKISELNSIGVMLPYTALHYLLFDFLDEPIVMTSANFPGEPVLIEEKPIISHILTNSRRIINRCDDSVIKIIANKKIFLRRSRGFTPLPIPLPRNMDKTILALGAEMNNTITVAKGNNAFMSQYIGNIKKEKTFEFFKQAIDKTLKLARATPEKIICDLHPEYNSTLYAKELSEKLGIQLEQVQHHKAHVAAVAGEHKLENYTGIAIDGLGYGDDGNIWGGEVFSVKNENEFIRVGSLEEQPMIGGDTATKNPNKMLLGILSKFMSEKEILKMKLFPEKETLLYLKQKDENFNVFNTTSTGRVLDAASALIGICNNSNYEGRAAMLLESYYDETSIEPIIKEKDGRKILMTTPLFEKLVSEKFSKEKIGGIVHNYVVDGLLKIAQNSGKADKITASGGVVNNRHITSRLLKRGVLTGKNLPPGDGCISYGQCIIGASRKN